MYIRNLLKYTFTSYIVQNNSNIETRKTTHRFTLAQYASTRIHAHHKHTITFSFQLHKTKALNFPVKNIYKSRNLGYVYDGETSFVY